LGKAEGQGCAKEGSSEENHCSKTDESSDEEKAVGLDESTVGGEEEGWS
jgi:hypothetical protein